MKKSLFSIFYALLLLAVGNTYAQTPSTGAAPQQTTTRKATTPARKWQRPATTRAYGTQPPAIRVDTAKNTDFSLNGQYRFLLSRSRSINGYKLINPNRLSAVWKSVNDTLSKERSALRQLKTKVDEQAKSISSMQVAVKGSENEVADTNARMDEITFLGISFSKGTYNIMVWSIIGILTIALIVVVARSTKSILEAKHRSQLYEEVSAEYQNFKAKSVEKERKLARELQDERNRIEELRGRG